MNTGLTPSIGQDPRTVFERLGGDAAFWRLARAFYRRVDRDVDPAFRSMFPTELEDAIRNQAEFLVQYFGGPTTYSERKGHPRLRMRHMPFAIDQAARDRWLAHMIAALDEAEIPEPEKSEMRVYFERTSQFLINRP